MEIRALVFDSSNVLTITPNPQLMGMERVWEQHLELAEGVISTRMDDHWRANSIGMCTENDVSAGMRDRVELNDERFRAFKRGNSDHNGRAKCANGSGTHS